MISASTQERIKQVLAMAQGDRVQAEKIIRQLIEREPKFLHELVGPFLPGIIAHALGGGDGRVAPHSTSAPISKTPPPQLDAVLKTLGRDLKAAPPPTKSSAKHAHAIHALAAAQAQRRKDT